jgi:hypothetical protein
MLLFFFSIKALQSFTLPSRNGEKRKKKVIFPPFSADSCVVSLNMQVHSEGGSL